MNRTKGIITTIIACLIALNIYLFWDPINHSSIHYNDSTIYDEMIQHIREKGILFQTPINESILKQKGIKQFLLDYDPYSNFLSTEENQIYQQSLKSNYVGVGMEIIRNKDKTIVCFPYDNQPAQIAGVQSGDLLVAVNGIDISDKSIFKVASMIKGRSGESVELTIKRSSDQPIKIHIKRSQVQAKSVFLKWYDRQPVIKICSFIVSTQREIKSLLRSIPKSDFIVIDLCNNPGGDLFSAIDSAMLFLPKNSPIIYINSKNQKKIYLSTTCAYDQSKIYLIQNQNTASAAEVFIAALTQNKRAESFGTVTFGKGTQQSLIQLSDNSLMIITTAYILPPNQISFHEKGLKPDYEISFTLISMDLLISSLSNFHDLPDK